MIRAAAQMWRPSMMIVILSRFRIWMSILRPRLLREGPEQVSGQLTHQIIVEPVHFLVTSAESSRLKAR